MPPLDHVLSNPTIPNADVVLNLDIVPPNPSLRRS